MCKSGTVLLNNSNGNDTFQILNDRARSAHSWYTLGARFNMLKSALKGRTSLSALLSFDKNAANCADFLFFYLIIHHFNVCCSIPCFI